jgi:hypothetical protein
VVWPGESKADRSWILENVKGAHAAVIMGGDKV